MDWTGFVKRGFVKGGFVKHEIVKGGFVKREFVKGGFVKSRFVKHGFVKGGFAKHVLQIQSQPVHSICRGGFQSCAEKNIRFDSKSNPAVS